MLRAWETFGSAGKIQEELVRQAEALGVLGSDPNLRPDLSEAEWVEARLARVAGIREHVNALTAALAVEAVVCHGLTYRRTASLLRVSTAALHKWLQEAAALGMTPPDRS